MNKQRIIVVTVTYNELGIIVDTKAEELNPSVDLQTEGLDEEIRCEMCRNQMKTDRGCDGNCKYDEKLYEKIMQILNERIKLLLSAEPCTESQCESVQDVPDTNVGDMIYRRDAIDALKAKAVPLHKDPECNDIWERDRTLDSAIDVIRGLPSAEPEPKDVNINIGLTYEQVEYILEQVKKQLSSAEPIIRCKDCTHRFVDGENVLYNCCELNHNKVQSDDWFCADAERKTDE